MSEPIEIRVAAVGAATALGRAKAIARQQGYRIRTVASVRPADAEGEWVVRLAVTRPEWAVVG